MDVPRIESSANRFDELHAEATEALAYAANSVRSVRDRYRQLHLDHLARWHVLTDELAILERELAERAHADGNANGPASSNGNGNGHPGSPAPDRATQAAEAAEAGAMYVQLSTTRVDVERIRSELGVHEAELSHLDLAIRNLEATWLFLERGDDSLITEQSMPTVPTELQMRIMEAQESERARLAQEVHDGPVQVLSNAIFQVEFVDRVFDSDPRLARTEIRFLRELLRRELGDLRSYLTQLRPPVLDQMGLEGAIQDTITTQAALSGLRIESRLEAPASDLTEAQQTVALRVVQEALQNVRKHSAATHAVVTTVLEDASWVLEVRDDGRGFDIDGVAARGRRNYGLQFMRERADLIGSQFEVRSRPEAGTVVRLAIPITRKESE